jgi:AraC family transcriptional regulator of adaptative response/methylated-DNA-[protein]-cysteine methyltransferase
MNTNTATLTTPPMNYASKLPPAPEMIRAFIGRDSTYDGLFYTGVKTTRIFCRPTCPAKKPKLENVEFFSDGKAAMFAGYRPCRRCRPLESGAKPPALVERLRRAVEAAPGGRIAEGDLRAMGIAPSTARRQFKKFFGMTFHAYHRASRMGLALRTVRAGSPVIEAQLDGGYESGSGFRAAFARLFGEPPAHAERADCFLARWLETPLGAMLALADDAGLHLLEFTDRRGLEREILQLRKRTRRAIVPGNNQHLELIARELEEYFAGSRTSFTVTLAPHGSPFQQQVWDELRRIPPGTTRSYGEMAVRLKNPKAIRAVGRANGSNSLAIVIPCHRVIRADGTLCGYAGGLRRKQWLLDHERKMIAAGEKSADS